MSVSIGLLQKPQNEEKKGSLDKNQSELQPKQKKSKHSYSSGSRSRNGRSRSKDDKKHKHKHKHKKRDSRSKSRDKSHKKHKHRDRDRDRDNYEARQRTRENRDRDRDREKDREREREKEKHKQRDRDTKKEQKLLPTEIPMPLPAEIPMPPIPGERKKRQRSRSPLNYYRRNQNNNDGQFWDSFSWVPRMNFLPTVTSSALANTKKMRRLMITNIPYQIGITEDDLRNLITRFMAQNYLKDEMNSCPVVNLQINEEDRNVAVQLSSVEETCRICKLEKIELFKGVINGIIRLGDSCYGNNVVTQAQTAAQAQAAAFAAINVLENKKTNFSVDNLRTTNNLTSTLIRITNAVTPYMAGQLTKEQWTQFEEDLIEGFSQFGKVVHHWLVRKDEKDLCADPGNLFIEYESKAEAEKAMGEMQGRIYDQRSITLYYVPRELYYQNYKKNTPPPAITVEKK